MHPNNIRMINFLHNRNLIINIVIRQHIAILPKQLPTHLLFLYNFNCIQFLGMDIPA